MSAIKNAINKISHYDESEAWRELRHKPTSVPMPIRSNEDYIKPEIEEEMDEYKKEHPHLMPKSKTPKKKLIEEYSALALNLYKAAKEYLDGGLSEKMDVGVNDVDKKELEMGKEVEKEHTSNMKMREQISLDHLAEIPSYYTRLNKMEEESKEDNDFNEEAEKLLK